jgi:site-specific recombinase XerD
VCSSDLIKITDVNISIGKQFLKQFRPPTFRKDSKETSDRPVIRCAVYRTIKLIDKKYPNRFLKSAAQKEVHEFYTYLVDECNLAVSTCQRYKSLAESFFTHFFGDKKITIKSLTPRMIRDYVEFEVPSTLDERRKKDSCSMLNSYFKYLQMKGIDVKYLSCGLPSFRSSHVLTPPPILSTKELNLLLDAVDRSTPNGKRTYAAILCQTDLCMRIGDVMRLELEDIDWRNGKIRIENHKGRKQFWLPLPKRVGEAIADYIIHGRPISKYKQLFRSKSWRMSTCHKSCILAEIAKLWKVTGLSDRFSGTRVLRHYGAIHMKSNQCSIKVISDILGHTSLQTTAIYAKVDIPMLRTIAQEWPEKEVSYEN